MGWPMNPKYWESREVRGLRSTEWDRFQPLTPQCSNDNCTSPYFAECIPLRGSAAKPEPKA